MTYLKISEQESQVYGIAFARGYIQSKDWQPNDLLADILEGEIDVARLKVPSTDDQLFTKLDSLGIPYSIYSLIVRNTIEITLEDIFEGDPELAFELYTAQQAPILQQVVRECIINRTATNYEDVDLAGIITQEKELEASDQYVQLYDNSSNPSRIGWLIKKGEEYIGYVFGTFRGEEFEGDFYGIIPAHRGTGRYARMVQQFLKDMCRRRGVRYFLNDVVQQNFSSLRSIIKESLVPIGSYFNIYLKPFLMKGGPMRLVDVEINNGVNIPNLMLQLAQTALGEGEGIASFDCKTIVKDIPNGIHELRISKPVFEQGQSILVLQLRKKLGGIYALAFIKTTN